MTGGGSGHVGGGDGVGGVHAMRISKARALVLFRAILLLADVLVALVVGPGVLPPGVHVPKRQPWCVCVCVRMRGGRMRQAG